MSKEAIEHYEAALKEAFPSGATGNVFHHWNEARKALAEQPAPPPECQTEAEKTAFAFGWFKALETVREQPAQPSKPWVGLTEEEIASLDLSAVTVKDAISDVRAVEAKLKEKNQ